MSDIVLVSTHLLELAGALRGAFEEAGYPVRLVTDPDDVDAVSDAGLLVLTGGADGDDEGVDRWTSRFDVPVFAVVGPESREERERLESLTSVEVFTSPVDPQEVVLTGRRAIERRRLQEATGIIGETEGMREVMERVVQIAPVESTVLVTGESGTGKELVARGLRALSPRRHKPFIAVNVAALSETLLESELFGHEKGAFTGAIDQRKGFFELADGGTIFLDEIGEMPLTTQTKLLRVLEQREFLRVGGERPIRVDLRVITATNQDLRRLVATGDFRKDLYYRLNILNIRLPALRERPEDIPRLVHHFIRELAERMDRPFPGISDEAMEILKAYEWPGNVRELRNLVESMVVLAPGKEIRPEDIPAEIRHARGRDRLLPVRVPKRELETAAEREEGGRELRPELEFVFRTLVELRVDMDELRTEFEEYREEIEERVSRAERPAARSLSALRDQAVEVEAGSWQQLGPATRELGTRGGEAGSAPAVVDSEAAEAAEAAEKGERAGGPEKDEADHREEEDTVVYRPGMTMEDLEREAILAVLRRTEGNRRLAAESLGIGERTLYRKIRKYGLEV